MKSGIVYYRDQIAGVIARFRSGSFEFRYLKGYRNDSAMPSIAATLPKKSAVYSSPYLFPFFFGLLSEGAQKASQCRMLRVDENDHFSRLLQACQNGCIGAVRVVPRRTE